MTFLWWLMKDISADHQSAPKLDSFSKVLSPTAWTTSALSPPQLQPASSCSLITPYLMQTIGAGKCSWTWCSSPHIKGGLDWACNSYYIWWLYYCITVDALVKSDICVTGQTCLDSLRAVVPPNEMPFARCKLGWIRKRSSNGGKGEARGGNVW